MKIKKYPSIYTLESLQSECVNQVTRQYRDGWVPARPLGMASFKRRVQIAWLVFTGKADAVIWPGGQ